MSEYGTAIHNEPTATEDPPAQQLFCSYLGKVCTHPRAMKPCGSLHKLCEFHRRKANANQKRMQQRRRMLLQRVESQPASLPSLLQARLTDALKPALLPPLRNLTSANRSSKLNISKLSRSLLVIPSIATLSAATTAKAAVHKAPAITAVSNAAPTATIITSTNTLRSGANSNQRR